MIVRPEGARTVTRTVKHYNLDAIIAVGYRVNSMRATAFRQWATKVLRELVLKGYSLDSERLKNGKLFDKQYFEGLLEEIREIRASERLFYQKVTDLFATASDYDPWDEGGKNGLANPGGLRHDTTSFKESFHGHAPPPVHS